MSLVADVAQWAIAIPVVLVLASIASRRRLRDDLVEAALAGALTIALVKAAAALRFEARPFVVRHVAPLVAHAPDNAFPSDHLAATGLAFAYLWPRSRPFALVTLAAGAAIAAARVLAALHWPVDVATGFALGVLAVVLVRLVPSPRPRSVTPSSSRGRDDGGDASTSSA